MPYIPPPPRNEQDFTGHSWQDWIYKLFHLVHHLKYENGHLYIRNGAEHAVATSNGVKTSTTTVTNTVTETTVYSYTLAANEMVADQRIMLNASGSITNASAADDYTIKIKLNGVLVHSLARVGGNVTNVGWRLLYEGTVRTIGSSGTYVDCTILSEGSISVSAAETTTHAIDTTVSNLFEVTVTWNNAKAGNTFSCTQGMLNFYH